MENTSGNSLIDAEDSLLIVIDVQDHFLRKLPEQEHHRLVRRIGWLIGVATRLDIPVLATVEDIKRWGGIHASLAEQLPGGTRVFDKMTFGLAAVPEIMNAVHETGRRTAILTGLETDVCVAQSAIGLLTEGYSSVAVSDACGSPEIGHVAGLQRMQAAGVTLVTVKSLYYEWIRTVEKDNEFMTKFECEIGLPDGIIL